MNFIRNLASVIKNHFQQSLSIDLWIDVLDAGYSDQEIEAFFGNSKSMQSPLLRGNRSLRQLVSILETRFSSRFSLWWVLIETQERRNMKKTFSQALVYPVFLLLLAWLTMAFINHTLVASLGSLSFASEEPKSSSIWFELLKGLEWLYLLVGFGAVTWLLTPRKFRDRIILRFYTHPFLEMNRNSTTQIFLRLLLSGLKRGIGLDDLLFALMNSTNTVQNELVRCLQEDLHQGVALDEAIQHVDQRLRFAFLLHDVNHSVEMNLQRYLTLLALKIRHSLSVIRWSLLGFAYISFGVIIVTAYQMMLEPLRVMEELL